jgi:hypothetical protein
MRIDAYTPQGYSSYSNFRLRESLILRAFFHKTLHPAHYSHTLTLALRNRIGRLAQLVRAPALQAGCRGFESLTAHQISIQDSPRGSNKHHKTPEIIGVLLFLLFNGVR